MSAVEFGLMLSLGLISTLHCAQMCGPIVVSYSLASIQGTGGSPRRWTSLFGHLAYNAGRILTYSLLGAVAGVAGQSMTWMGRLAGLSHTASLVAGAVMIIGGVAMLGWLPALASLGQSSAVVTSRFLRPLRELLTSPKLSRRFALGLALGLLPCGLIYAALMKSLAASSALGGALDMLAFGMGTASSLLAIGLLSTSFRFNPSRWGSQVAAAAVILMGAVLLWRASMPAIFSSGGHAASWPPLNKPVPTVPLVTISVKAQDAEEAARAASSTLPFTAFVSGCRRHASSFSSCCRFRTWCASTSRGNASTSWGESCWISEFGILFLSMMFLLFVIAAMAMIYGRIYCGYLCPQMIFSEASVSTENEIRRLVNKYVNWDKQKRELLGRAIFLLLLRLVSVVLAFVFISYFVEPRDLFRRLMSLDIRTAGGIAGATTTLITFLDFWLLRQRFCTTVCPYGYLQGILGDGNTLLVHYRDPDHECIECKKCVRVCEMGIDIRNSPFQIECIHCADCIDACNEVLGRLGKKGLIHYSWGDRRRRTTYGRAGFSASASATPNAWWCC